MIKDTSVGATDSNSPLPASSGERVALIGKVDCLRQFFVLALLITEATLASVLALYRFAADDKGRALLQWIVVAMIAIFVVVVVLVTILGVLCPEKLHLNAQQLLKLYAPKKQRPELDPSALKDSIRTIVRKELRRLGLIPLPGAVSPAKAAKEVVS